jgi:hypothetical protein
MLSMHAGNVMCARITEQLWLRHSRLYRQKMLLGTGPSRKDSNASHHSRWGFFWGFASFKNLGSFWKFEDFLAFLRIFEGFWEVLGNFGICKRI